MIDERIKGLDDATAQRLLSAVAGSRLAAGGFRTELTPELREALAAEVGGQPTAVVFPIREPAT